MPITCPYCFEKFQHNEVLFRSERVNEGECPDIPEQFEDYEQFKIRYAGPADQKKAIMQKCEDWNFFREGEDEVYNAFWERYGGTTTERITRQKASYLRRIINPNSREHQRYLRPQGAEGNYIKCVDGFATSVTLTTGEVCTQRVCPKCHNPLPNQYGRNEARFIAVIGVTGAGKTVYLSQLVYDFEDYVAKAGLASMHMADSALAFRREYPVNTKDPLPGSTPPGQFLQPLFYNLSKTDENGQKKVYTLVIYDVAGENCEMEKSLAWFGPFIAHMQGIFLLIDPMQFKVIKGVNEDVTKVEKGSPTTVLSTIHSFISQDTKEKCNVPLAVCISKSDMEAVQDVLEDDLVDALMDDIDDVRDAGGRPLARFNSASYNPIAEKLQKFIQKNERALELLISTNYSCYNYFAFSSLGCDVENNVPVGPIMPKRIEEPLLWLFHKFGFIGAEPPVIEYGAPCPQCHSTANRRMLSGAERIVVTRRGLFGKVKETQEYSYYCEKCQKYYD